MFIELVDALRCPESHEESWLVAAATRMESRHIVDGTLGCPVCKAEYPIRDGVADFRRGRGQVPAQAAQPDGELAMRLAALLDLADSQGFAVLLGTWGSQAAELSAIAETPLILVDPPEGVIGAPGISVVLSDGEIPLAVGTARAMAIDAAEPARVASAVRATRQRGRVLGPVAVALPDGVKELVRDASVWVGERESVASPLITLHVRRGIDSA
ncbi:MAG: Trm112 family protein [bacterium]